MWCRARAASREASPSRRSTWSSWACCPCSSTSAATALANCCCVSSPVPGRCGTAVAQCGAVEVNGAKPRRRRSSRAAPVTSSVRSLSAAARQVRTCKEMADSLEESSRASVPPSSAETPTLAPLPRSSLPSSRRPCSMSDSSREVMFSSSRISCSAATRATSSHRTNPLKRAALPPPRRCGRHGTPARSPRGSQGWSQERFAPG
mmetsp:Transcript_80643/g.180467  ORF Transcript_80643/g.180467 Transcript_80643/m.180467 type:complete len:205 (-) Transcript_80643:45-659(-)